MVREPMQFLGHPGQLVYGEASGICYYLVGRHINLCHQCAERDTRVRDAEWAGSLRPCERCGRRPQEQS